MSCGRRPYQVAVKVGVNLEEEKFDALETRLLIEKVLERKRVRAARIDRDRVIRGTYLDERFYLFYATPNLDEAVKFEDAILDSGYAVEVIVNPVTKKLPQSVNRQLGW